MKSSGAGTGTRRVALVLCVAAAAALLVLVASLVTDFLFDYDELAESRRNVDSVRAGLMGRALMDAGGPRAKDGRLDVYRVLLASRDAANVPRDAATVAYICRSERWGKGPTPDDVLANDYSRFPYRRFRGSLPETRRPIPIVWDTVVDSTGRSLVGFSDGSAGYVTCEVLELTLERYEQSR